MHARIQELLAFRDGEPLDAGVRAHIERCEDCGAEVRRAAALKTGLRRLPSHEAPPQGFEAVRARLQAPTRRPSRYAPAVATAGTMLACLAGFVWMLHRQVSVSASVSGRDGVAHEVGIAPLVAHSQRLEALLRALPPRPAAERAANSVTIDELQSRIQLLDLELSTAGSDREQVRNLWSTRVQLLNSLVYMRYAESAGRSGAPVELGVI